MNNNKNSKYLAIFNLDDNLPTAHYPLNTKPEGLYFDCASVDGFVEATNHFYSISNQ